MNRLPSWVLLLAACGPGRAAPPGAATDTARTVPAATVPAATAEPTFADFPAQPAFAGAPAPVDLTSPSWAHTFRTTLREGAVTGPNFAGEFTIITWGCGTMCRSYAIVSARTGRVFPDTTLDFSCHQPEYQLGSTLVIERSDSTDTGPCGEGTTRYLRWTGDSFMVVPD